MRGKTFKNQEGNSTLVMALVMSAVTGLGIKAASDRFSNRANASLSAKQNELAENAIDAAVAKAEALLRYQLSPAGARINPAIMALPLSTNVAGTVSLSDNAPVKVDWAFKNNNPATKTIDITVQNAAGANLSAPQVVSIAFNKPITLPSPYEPPASNDPGLTNESKRKSPNYVLRGFEVVASTSVSRKNGSQSKITRAKQLIVDSASIDGAGGTTDCILEGPGYVVEPNVGAKARLRVKGGAVLANVPRESEELGQVIQPQAGGLQIFNAQTQQYESMVSASKSLFFTRFVGAADAKKKDLRNDFSVEDRSGVPVDANGYHYWDFEFSTPRALTAVDGGLVTFPMWATVKLADGTWKSCSPTTVQVRQVTSCEFAAPSRPEINYTQATMNLKKSDYDEFAPILAKKGYVVPGCNATCGSLTTQSSCDNDSKCFWYTRASDNIASCFYKDPGQQVACDKSNVDSQNGPITLTKNQNNVQSSTDITWNQGQGKAPCLSMDAEILPPNDDRYFNERGKFIGDLPKLKVKPSCANKTLTVEVDSLNVPDGLYRVMGSYKSKEGVGTCMAVVKVGVDPCPYTNLEAKAVDLPFRIYGTGYDFYGTFTVQPRSLPESEYYAPDPNTSVRCTDNNMRCYYLLGQLTNRTLFAHVDNPNLPTCSIVPVERFNLGCFAYGSKIMMGDGLLIEGQTVKEGDYVWNPVIKMPVKVVGTTHGPERPALLEFKTTKGQVIRVTTNHPMLTASGLKAAKNVNIGETLQSVDGGFAEITSISNYKPQGSFVWNVRLEGDGKDESMHYVLVDGVITGDLTLQEKLETAFKVSKKE